MHACMYVCMMYVCVYMYMYMQMQMQLDMYMYTHMSAVCGLSSFDCKEKQRRSRLSAYAGGCRV